MCLIAFLCDCFRISGFLGENGILVIFMTEAVLVI